MDFCSSLRISTGVTLAESNGVWTLRVIANGRDSELMTAVATCSAQAAGAKLAKSIDAALRKVVSQSPDKIAEMRRRAGRQMPMVLMKQFLFSIAGACSSCSGRGCTACSGVGV